VISRNSTIIALGNTLASLLCACLGAYALARLRPGRADRARAGRVVPGAAVALFIQLFAVLATAVPHRHPQD
jgi:ABC-type glycerol-3-phosphate transport system permease component